MPVGQKSRAPRAAKSSRLPQPPAPPRRIPATSPLRASDEQKRALLIRVDTYRLEQNLTWPKLAELCGVSIPTIYKAIEWGQVITDLTYGRIVRHIGPHLGITQVEASHAE